MTLVYGNVPAKIPLTRGLFAIVDNDQCEFLSQWKWHAHPRSGRTGGHYAARHSDDGATLYMHRVIWGAPIPDGLVIDFKDKDGLNNRRDNLRLATASKTAVNRRKVPSRSRFKGIWWDRQRHMWQARLYVCGARINLGRFSSEDDAAAAYASAAIEHYGEFARLDDSFALLLKPRLAVTGDRPAEDHSVLERGGTHHPARAVVDSPDAGERPARVLVSVETEQ